MASGETMCIESMVARGSRYAMLWLPGKNDICLHPHVVAAVHQSGADVHVCHHRGLPMNHRYGNLVDPLFASNHASGSLDDLCEDIDTTLLFLRTQGYDGIVAYGHSTGGLALANYVRLRGDSAFVAFYYNSPFLCYSIPAAGRVLQWMDPLLSAFAPYPVLLGGYTSPALVAHYARFEWDLSERSLAETHTTAGFLVATSRAQHALQCAPQRVLTHKPVALAVSQADDILNWRDIVDKSTVLGTVRPVPDLLLPFGHHDVFKSPLPEDTDAAVRHLRSFLHATLITAQGPH
jgi:alpha-beta hydrolase superfamily lysophospholipase